MTVLNKFDFVLKLRKGENGLDYMMKGSGEGES